MIVQIHEGGKDKGKETRGNQSQCWDQRWGGSRGLLELFIDATGGTKTPNINKFDAQYMRQKTKITHFGGFLWLWDFCLSVTGGMFRDGDSQHGGDNLEEAQRALKPEKALAKTQISSHQNGFKWCRLGKSNKP